MYNCGPTDPCLYVVWPKSFWGSYFKGGDPAAGDWAGSLIRGQQDISGLMYRRNRYYDPMTGQFTQSDPIGIAGGLNTYGFAAGDPVSFSDPFGLKVDCGNENSEACFQWNALKQQAQDAMRSDRADITAAGKELWDMISGLEADEQTYQIRMGQRSFIKNWLDRGGYTWTSNRVDAEGRQIIKTEIDIDYAERRDRVPRMGVLAHEAGHAWAMMQRRNNYVEAGIKTENAWRTLHNCAHRATHASEPPRCIY
jgi:RHS repeat-associated protein